MRNVIMSGLMLALAFRLAASSKSADRPKDPPPCSAEMIQAIESMKSRKTDANIAPPVPVVMPEPEFTESARKQLRKKHGPFADIILGLMVDAEGNPKDVCLIQPAGFGLDASAADAARKYKFKPALDHGNPIAYPTSVGVSFNVF